MNREQKQSVVTVLKDSFEKAEGTFVVTIQGLDVSALQKIRQGLRADGARLRIAKNTLLRHAVSDVQGLQDLATFFSGQIGMVFAPQDSIGVVKTLAGIAKDHETLKFVCGVLEGKVLSLADVKALSQLPSKAVLQAQILATINAPVVRLASLYVVLMMKLLWLVSKAAERAEQSKD